MNQISQLPIQLPKRLNTALHYLDKLNAIGIYLIPIRHHSPACAYGVKQALNELNPNDVLIEAPASFNELLDDLQHPDNKPPLAVLCQTEVTYVLNDMAVDDTVMDDIAHSVKSDQPNQQPTQKQTIKQHHSAYYPFCDYSPEWVALNYPAHATDQQSTNHQTTPYKPNIEFIDLPWSQKVAHQENLLFGKNAEQNQASQSLQQERYLAHSHYIKALADKLHCRDHDEVWAHLFELDSNSRLQDWRAYFHNVLVWCAMSRLDYEEEVLANEGALLREAHMAERIIERHHSNKSQFDKSQANKSQANMVIVTGGFHTLALIETLYARLVKNEISAKPKPNSKSNSKPLKSNLSTASTTTTATTTINTSSDEAWLIRYSFDRLDALNGYASGMPSPAFYQACWEQRLEQDRVQYNLSKPHNQSKQHNPLKTPKTNKSSARPTPCTVQNDIKARESLIVNFISDFSRQLRDEQVIQSNFISVKTASEQAIRLADLREHRLIGRYDLMDACTSSFLKGSSDEGYHRFHQLLQQKLGGFMLGHVISTTRTPPVLAQVYELVRSNRFKLDDTLSKTAKLDVLRKPNHRSRSRLLHLLAFLQVGFARRLSGPDFLHGGQLHLLFEEWQYAWTPQVEARLIELSEQGSDIYQIAIERLLKLRSDDGYQHNHGQNSQGQNNQGQQNPAQAQSSSVVVNLLIQASMMGLSEQMTLLFSEIKHILPNDPDLSSVLASAQHLLYLWTGRAFLELNRLQIKGAKNGVQPSGGNGNSNGGVSGNNGSSELINLIKDIPPTALFLLSQAQTPNDDQIEDTLTQVLDLRNILKQIQPIIDGNVLNDTLYNTDGLADFHQTLQRLLPSWQDIDLLVGAVHALQFVDDVINEHELASHLTQHFGVGAQAEQAVAYLLGMMRAVPTLFLHYRDLSQMIDRLVASWDNDTFVALLPDLRLAFTGLKPMQTNQLANQIADLHNTSATAVTHYQGQLSEVDMMQGVALNQQLEVVLNERGLLEWFS